MNNRTQQRFDRSIREAVAATSAIVKPGPSPELLAHRARVRAALDKFEDSERKRSRVARASGKRRPAI